MCLAVFLQTVFDIAQLVVYHHEAFQYESLGLHSRLVLVCYYILVIEREHHLHYVFAAREYLVEQRHTDNPVRFLGKLDIKTTRYASGHIAGIVYEYYLVAFKLWLRRVALQAHIAVCEFQIDRKSDSCKFLLHFFHLALLVFHLRFGHDITFTGRIRRRHGDCDGRFQFRKIFGTHRGRHGIIAVLGLVAECALAIVGIAEIERIDNLYDIVTAPEHFQLGFVDIVLECHHRVCGIHAERVARPVGLVAKIYRRVNPVSRYNRYDVEHGSHHSHHAADHEPLPVSQEGQ